MHALSLCVTLEKKNIQDMRTIISRPSYVQRSVKFTPVLRSIQISIEIKESTKELRCEHTYLRFPKTPTDLHAQEMYAKSYKIELTIKLSKIARYGHSKTHVSLIWDDTKATKLVGNFLH
jgi:hypothetical protein